MHVYAYISDVLLIADRKCSGRQSCMIRIPDPEFDTTHPCLDELKTYFEASFSCRKGKPKIKHCVLDMSVKNSRFKQTTLQMCQFLFTSLVA